MTRADRVLSTPPTNTSALPAVPSRRGFLAQAAVAAAGGAGGAALGLALPLPGSADASAIVPDPVFNLIEAHRTADASHRKALQVQSRFERRHGACARAWEISEKPCNDEDDAFEAMVATPATTIAGLLALLAYLEELDSAFETEWMLIDRLFTPTLIKTFAISLKNIGVQA